METISRATKVCGVLLFLGPLTFAGQPTAAWATSTSAIPATTSSSGPSLPTVPQHPSGVSIVWLPGLNNRSDKAVVTYGSSRIASALADDVNTAPLVADGVVATMCPNDDGTSARLYFKYHHRATRLVYADLSGCSSITASSNVSLSSTAKFRRDLSTLAPRAWAGVRGIRSRSIGLRQLREG
jgi:hypothetical protein